MKNGAHPPLRNPQSATPTKGREHAKTFGVRNGGAPRRVLLFPARKLVEVAPGLKMAGLAKEHVPEIAIARMQALGDGSYRPILKIYEPTIRITEAAKTLNVPYRTLLRLCRAGFVEYWQITPCNYQVNLTSWFEHIDRVRKDPEFWSRKENIRKYRDAL